MKTLVAAACLILLCCTDTALGQSSWGGLNEGIVNPSGVQIFSSAQPGFVAVTNPNTPVVEIASTAVTTAVTLVPKATTARYRVVLYNTASSGIAWCRADGAAAVIGTGIPIQPLTGTYEWLAAGAGRSLISCIASTGTVTISGEYVQQ